MTDDEKRILIVECKLEGKIFRCEEDGCCTYEGKPSSNKMLIHSGAYIVIPCTRHLDLYFKLGWKYL
jgi:hypothetical protein